MDENNKEILIKDGAHGLSTFMSYPILTSVAKLQEERLALRMMKEYYGGMLSVGATTFWEDFDVNWLKNASRIDELPSDEKVDIHGDYGLYCYKGYRHSFCHGWSAGPVAFLAEYVLGIRVMEAGGKKIMLCPELCDLDYAKGSYPTKYGIVSVEWRKKGDRAVLTNLVCPKEVDIIFDGSIV